MITEHGTESYKALLVQLDPCACHVCRRGTAARTTAATGEAPPCAKCGGSGTVRQMQSEDGSLEMLTCSSCLGGG